MSTPIAPVVFHTSRLRLRPARADDLDALHACWSHPDVCRHLFDGRAPSRAEAGRLLDDARSWPERGLGLWIIEHRQTARAAGCAGLRPLRDGIASCTDTVEPLIALHPSHWWQGLAQEALQPLLSHAFRKLALPALGATVDVGNLASRRLLERLGFTVADPRPAVLAYRLEAAAFRRACRARMRRRARADQRRAFAAATSRASSSPLL